MTAPVRIAFAPEVIELPLASILPLRKVPEQIADSARYRRIAQSIAEVVRREHERDLCEREAGSAPERDQRQTFQHAWIEQAAQRSEERAVGKEWVSTCRSVGSQSPSKIQKTQNK